jgi:hypothetical protein
MLWVETKEGKEKSLFSGKKGSLLFSCEFL